MKRLFTLIALLAFTVGMIGCTPKSNDAVVDDTNALPPVPDAPASTNQ